MELEERSRARAHSWLKPLIRQGNPCARKSQTAPGCPGLIVPDNKGWPTLTTGC